MNEFNYVLDISFNGFRGSGLVVLNLMAGSFSNQFTTLSFNMGKNAVPLTSPAVFNIIRGILTVASLTNQQMQAVAVTANNDFQVQGKQTAMTTVQGTPDVQRRLRHDPFKRAQQPGESQRSPCILIRPGEARISF